MMLAERHSHKKFWLAIVILAIVAIAFLVATALVSNELNKTQNSLLLVRSELVTTQARLTNVEAELATTKEYVESLEATLSNLQVNYERLTTGYGYVLRDPSYQEMEDFLAQDKTDRGEYDTSEYTCVNFAADVKANAAKKGIRCAYVVIEYPEKGGHAIVAFDTTDRGLVYVDPQLDWEVKPKIGKRYYQCVIPQPGYYLGEPDYDDTVRRIIVIW